MKKHTVFRVITIPAYINLILRGQMKFLGQYYAMIGVSDDEGFHFQQISPREGIPMVAIPFRRVINVFQDLHCLISLIRLFIKYQPSIVHTETPKSGLIGMIAARICGVPIRIHSIVGIPLYQLESGLKGRILGWMEEITVRCSTIVVPNSESLFKEIGEFSYIKGKNKLQFFGYGSTNGVDLQRFVPNAELRRTMREQWGISEEQLVLGYVGRIARDKGSREMLDAFRALKDKYPSLVLLVVGLPETEYGELGPGFIEELRNTEGVVLAGRQPEVAPYFTMMDMLVHPTYREGLPNALLEASATELPIVSTDIPGCNEVVENGVSGILVTPRSTVELRDAIEMLVLDSEKRRTMGKAGRERVKQRYEQSMVWKYWKELYDRSLVTVR